MEINRVSIDVTPEQHKRLKAVAALSGKTLKEYVLEKTLPIEDDEQAAITELLEYLDLVLSKHSVGDSQGALFWILRMTWLIKLND